jgi:CubicO group peptidase (beta-lactamase class C family)
MRAISKRHIPGLSLAIIKAGAIVRKQAYGFADRDHRIPAAPSTLFQAGSLSKPVSALGALSLVEKRQLSLDQDVNTTLRTWLVPQSELTKDSKVTLRRILSHSAGLTVHGFPGYVAGEPIPSLVQVLNGQKPANSPAIRVKQTPGTQWNYSGGGYVIMQQLVIDAAGEPFSEFMNKAVLKPLGMTSSSYSQRFPEKFTSEAAVGYRGLFASAIKGQWHIYPEMAAAGLWTTAGDLARFAIAIQRSAAGASNAIISPSLTREMLTRQMNDDGLGVFLSGSGESLRFAHDGRNAGFDSAMRAYAGDSGNGAVIMINKNDDSGAINDIFHAIAQQYHWRDHDVAR